MTGADIATIVSAMIAAAAVLLGTLLPGTGQNGRLKRIDRITTILVKVPENDPARGPLVQYRGRLARRVLQADLSIVLFIGYLLVWSGIGVLVVLIISVLLPNTHEFAQVKVLLGALGVGVLVLVGLLIITTLLATFFSWLGGKVTKRRARKRQASPARPTRSPDEERRPASDVEAGGVEAL